MSYTGRKLVAPEGKFLVVGVDTFSYDDWHVGVFDTEREAVEAAIAEGGPMTMVHVYDDKGKHLHQSGTH